jgi:TetR/AcrR family transcriptional regulator, tetracycline repressor protein
VEPAEGRSSDWSLELTDHMRRLRHVVLRHPALGAVLATRGLTTPSVFRNLEAGIGLLRSAGLDRRTAVQIYYALLTYTLGFLAWEIPRMHRGPATYRQEWQDALAALPVTEYPTLHELAEELPHAAGERQFEAGLEALLRGFEAAKPRTDPRDGCRRPSRHE